MNVDTKKVNQFALETALDLKQQRRKPTKCTIGQVVWYYNDFMALAVDEDDAHIAMAEADDNVFRNHIERCVENATAELKLTRLIYNGVNHKFVILKSIENESVYIEEKMLKWLPKSANLKFLGDFENPSKRAVVVVDEVGAEIAIFMPTTITNGVAEDG